MNFDHMGIVVPDISTGMTALQSYLPIVGATARFDDYGLGVSVQFLKDRSGVTFELIAPLGENSPVQRVAAKRENVLNQLAYRVADLDKAASEMRSRKAIPTGQAKAALAFKGARVQFFYLPLGFIVELIEAENFDHQFTAA